MKRKLILATALLISCSLFFGACNSEEKPKGETTATTQEPATNQSEVHGTPLGA